MARWKKENILSERAELLRQKQEWLARLGQLEKNILNKLGKKEKDWRIRLDENMVVKVEALAM